MRAHWGRLVRERRKEMGFSIAHLARSAGVSENTVKNIESCNGKTMVDNLESILNALALDLEVIDAVAGDRAHFAIVRDTDEFAEHNAGH